MEISVRPWITRLPVHIPAVARETRRAETDGLVTHLVEFYRNHDPLLVPSPEIPGILRELGGRYRLGLLSDGYLGVQQRKLAALRPRRLLPRYCVYRFMGSGKLETESKTV